MKILIYRTNILKKTETFIKSQVETIAMLDKGNSVCLMGLNEDANGVDLGTLNVKILSPKIKFINYMFNFIFNKFDYIRNLLFLFHMKILNPDIIHIHFGTDAVKFKKAISWLNKPVIVTLHGYDITVDEKHWISGRYGSDKITYLEDLNDISKLPNVFFIAVSEYIKKSAIKKGLFENVINVKYIGVDVEKFSKPPEFISNKTDILFVGRLVEKKGCIYLLDAFSKIQNKFPRTTLNIIGSGPLEFDLHQYAKERNTRCKFFGAQSNDVVLNLLQKTRVFCLPSITAFDGDAEGLPISILEAQACGVPVLTSANNGNCEGIIHGKTGFNVMEKDVDNMAKHLDLLLSNDFLIENMSKNAIDFIHNAMDINVCTDALYKFYCEVKCKL